jgi:hypothetical protein
MSEAVRCGAARLAAAQPLRRAPLARRHAPPRFVASGVRSASLRLVTAQGAQSQPEAAPPRRRGLPRKVVAGDEASQAKPQKRRQRAPRVGELGEKTVDGKPKPDERTVEDLVRRGWFESEDEVLQVLGKASKRSGSRFPYETAEPAADWLEATLGLEQLKGGLLPAAKAVKAFPELLYRDAATLQRKWDALTLPAEQAGVGIAFSQEQAREAVRKYPQVLIFALDTLKRGWSMLTATEGGLGLLPEEARSCILRSPAVLRFDHDAVVRRVELLKSLGYPKAYKMVLKEPRVLSYTEECVRERDAWWKQSGLDHVKIVEAHPTLLGGSSTMELQEKLSFLRDVAGLSTDDLNLAAPILAYSLDKKLRPRFFYAWKHGALERNKLSSLTFCSDALYLRKVHQLDAPASEDEVDLFKEMIASADFLAWAAQQEEARVRPQLKYTATER